MADTFACDLCDVPQWSLLKTKNPETRKGRYHQSVFTIPDYGRLRWVVTGYIDFDWKKPSRKLSKEEIVAGCLEYLNQPHQTFTPTGRPRKNSKPKYGKIFECVHSELVEKDGKRLIAVYLVVEEQKSSFFWGEGPVFAAAPKKRGRKKKEAEDEEA